MNRRDFIKGIGIAVAAAKTVPFIPSLITTPYVEEEVITGTTSFQQMLEEYLPYDLLKEEIQRDNWLLEKKDKIWTGGTYTVQFKGGDNG